MKSNQEYKLNDFYLAVILKSAGLPLLRLEPVEGKFVNFVFLDEGNQAEKIIKDYWNRKTNLTDRDLIDNINELKTRIYSRKGH